MGIRRFDINADVGEGSDSAWLESDIALMGIVSSVNIACGVHAGSPDAIATLIRAAVSADVAIGAHPGLPDREGAGRRTMSIEPASIANQVIYQLGAMDALVRYHGGRLRHVKPHGALYHMAETDPAVAGAIVDATGAFDSHLILVGLAGGALIATAKASGLSSVGEIFADRAYLPSGGLVPRDEPGALLTAPAEVRGRMATYCRSGTVEAMDGSTLRVDARTVCVHGDSPGAVATAAAVRTALEREGIVVGPGI